MELPWQYSFPPFFTLQINEDTKKKQLDAWCDLVLNYCKHNRIYQLDASECQNSELFSNKKIDRKCSVELVNVIFEELVRRGRAEWVNLKQSKKCFILWHTQDEWARIIYDFVNRRGLQNSVCTFYELIDSKDNKNEKFHKMDSALFKKCLNVLQQQKKCEVFQLDSNENGDYGVKFF